MIATLASSTFRFGKFVQADDAEAARPKPKSFQ